MESFSKNGESADNRIKAYKKLRKTAIRKMYDAPPIDQSSLYVPKNPATVCVTPKKDKIGIERHNDADGDRVSVGILKRDNTGEHLISYDIPKNGPITRTDSEISAFGAVGDKLLEEMGVAFQGIHKIGQLIGATAARNEHIAQGIDGLPITAEEADMIAELISAAEYDYAD